jgi:hypothetical protein
MQSSIKVGDFDISPGMLQAMHGNTLGKVLSPMFLIHIMMKKPDQHQVNYNFSTIDKQIRLYIQKEKLSKVGKLQFSLMVRFFNGR